jgi:hypothetical protein
MNSFSFNRFCKTLRWVLANNFRLIAGGFVGYMALFFLAELFILSISNTSGHRSYDDVLMNSVADFPTIFILVNIVFFLSMIFFNYDKKAKREAHLMLPATNLEKYLSAMFLVTVVLPLVVLIGFVVGDTLRMVVRAVFYGNEWISTVPRVLNNLTPDAFKRFSVDPAPVPFKLTVIYFALSLITWIHSLYVFCGTLMRKYSFVVATAALILSFAFFLWIGYDKLQLNMFYGTTDGDGVLVYEVGALGYILCVILPLLAVFNYWASFYIFKGFQLITNKWTNYDILKR